MRVLDEAGYPGCRIRPFVICHAELGAVRFTRWLWLVWDRSSVISLDSLIMISQPDTEHQIFAFALLAPSPWDDAQNFPKQDCLRYTVIWENFKKRTVCCLKHSSDHTKEIQEDLSGIKDWQISVTSRFPMMRHLYNSTIFYIIDHFLDAQSLGQSKFNFELQTKAFGICSFMNSSVTI